ncbi:SDR family NAD(P)-dependent oxidoreductase [uncultured Sphingomonas sp.]|uniref:SDR family NAD(P)-dependent oxidoreductase n=1 Tax=uncultured Sphingomonas sp. TaxID=158754 RepID=UPI0035CA1CA6
MTLSLEGRVAIVTGAGAGLGREHALLLARRGAKVVVNDPGGSVNGVGGDESAAAAVVDEIRSAGGTAVANVDSVASEEGAGRIIDAAVQAFGGVHVLVNNAGILRDRSFAKLSLEDFRAVVDVHFWGAVHCTRAVWPILNAQKYGRVVMTTSVSGTSGNFGQSSYGAAKEGVLGLMRALALEGVRNDVLVNAISPGALTRMSGEVAPDDPFMRRLDPALVSPAVAWLASARCDVSATIITAAAGGFGRLHYFETSGVQFDPAAPVTVEMFDAAFARIADLDNAAPTRPGTDGRIMERLDTLADR